MLLIFVSSSIPAETFPKVSFWGWAKLVHLLYYMILCYLVQRALRRQVQFPKLAEHPFLYGFIVTVLYGATDEFHQLFTPGRHGQLSDVFIDSLGAMLSFIAIRRWRKPTSQDGRQAVE